MVFVLRAIVAVVAIGIIIFVLANIGKMVSDAGRKPASKLIGGVPKTDEPRVTTENGQDGRAIGKSSQPRLGSPEPTQGQEPFSSLEKDYIQSIGQTIRLVERTGEEFDRVSQDSATRNDLLSMLTNNAKILKDAIYKIDGLRPPDRFRKGHSAIQISTYSLKDAFYRLQAAMEDDNKQLVRDSLQLITASRKAVNDAKMQIEAVTN